MPEKDRLGLTNRIGCNNLFYEKFYCRLKRMLTIFCNQLFVQTITAAFQMQLLQKNIGTYAERFAEDKVLIVLMFHEAFYCFKFLSFNYEYFLLFCICSELGWHHYFIS